MNNLQRNDANEDDPNQELFDDLVEKFTQECREGLTPSIDDYTANHPEIADQIRDFFPTIKAIESFGRVDNSQKRFQQAQAKFDIERPKSIGEYKIVREIGRGGMGIVYEAIQQSLDRPIAIKILLRTSSDAKQILRFEREAATAAKLHHTNIVPVFAVGKQGEYHYYVMQLIDGVGFDQVIVALKNPSVAVPHPQLSKIAKWLPDVDALHNGRYYRSVAKIARSLANALSYAHQQGTLHRDIKPANLLIDTDGHVWLADFGLAKAIESQDDSRTGDVVGTLKYMSPEQFAGKPDHRSDIYGLGLTIYELITLQPAYNDSSRSHLIFDRKKNQNPPPSPSKLVRHLPKDLGTIVMKACALDPETRYQTAADLEADLDNFLLDRPIAARPPSAFENCYKWCRRNPAVAALSSLAFALLMVIAALSSVAYLRANAALGKETEQRMLLEIEKSRSDALRSKTKNTLDISLAALDKIFQRLTPETSETDLVSTIEDSDGQQITLQADPIISTETASLLEEMLLVYDRLAQQDADDPRLKADSADAIAHVGKIHEQLGAHDKAAYSLRTAIERYQSISGKQLEIAKLHNVLGTILRNQQQHSEAETSFKTSIELLNNLLQDTSQASSDTKPEIKIKIKIELARAHCLLAKQQPDAYDLRPPPKPPGLFGPMIGRGGPPPKQRRTNVDQQLHLQTAKEILLKLIDSGKASPEVRFLLALCYRDSREQDGGSRRDDAIETLRALAEDFPHNNEFQFALAEILASSEHRFFEADDQQSKLEESIAILEKLTTRNPNIPRFVRLHAQTMHRCGMDQLHQTNQPSDREVREVIDLLKRSKEAQDQLVLEFPDSFELKYWQAKMTGGYAEGLILEERYEDAFDELTTATTIAEELSEDEAAGVPALHLLIQLQRELARVHRKRGDKSQEKAAKALGEEFRKRLPPPPRRNGRRPR